jgi:SAM-dependent methyltransferase
MNDMASSRSSSPICLVCGEARSHLRFVQRGYPVYRCAGCGLEFVWPIPGPAELAEYYDRGYSVPLERYAAAGARNVARIADVERWCPDRGRLLEIGASYGHSLAAARERGWDVAGIELSPTASAHARNQLGLDVQNCDLLDAPLPAGSFDAVVMWHVLEHVRDPQVHALRIAELLRPGGFLGLRVPNAASFGARVAGQWWPWMCPPAHLWFFSATTLPRLLEACGFEIVEVRTLRGDGNNVYQYALMAAGNWLNEARQAFRPRAGVQARSMEPAAAAPPSGASAPLPTPPRHSSPARQAVDQAQEPGGLLQKWLHVLERAQPVTNAMARGTRPIIEPIERRGWGDELLVYARNKGTGRAAA